MAVVKVTIDIGAGPVVKEINPEDLTLGFLEDLETAQETNKWRDLLPVFGEMLTLTRKEMRAITIAQFNEIGKALQGATGATVPNASAPVST